MAELLKYKKERNSSQSEGGRAKTKRVPTVKKELSTQKEILIGSNETQVPKSLVPPEDPANRLNEETDAIQRRNVESNRVSPTNREEKQHQSFLPGTYRVGKKVWLSWMNFELQTFFFVVFCSSRRLNFSKEPNSSLGKWQKVS